MISSNIEKILVCFQSTSVIIFTIYLLPFLLFSVPRPIRIPTSVKLIFIMKTDPSNRFILKGDGNAAKARYNMQADSYQESVWVDKWRDDIALFLIKQQWSIPSVGTLRDAFYSISYLINRKCLNRFVIVINVHVAVLSFV